MRISQGSLMTSVQFYTANQPKIKADQPKIAHCQVPTHCTARYLHNFAIFLHISSCFRSMPGTCATPCLREPSGLQSSCSRSVPFEFVTCNGHQGHYTRVTRVTRVASWCVSYALLLYFHVFSTPNMTRKMDENGRIGVPPCKSFFFFKAGGEARAAVAL